MAVNPGSPAPPPPRKRRGGCFGCLLPFLIIIAVLGGGFYFLVANAAASVSVPAQLLVVTPTTTLTHSGSAQPAKSGALVHEGDSIRNDDKGRSMVQFEDGSIIRLAPATQVTLASAQFDRHGKLSNVTVSQQSGRTMSTVEKLIVGAKFTIQGHSANASVRGTRYEVIINKDGSIRLKVLQGVVAFGPDGHTINVNAGQQADADPNGKVSQPIAIQPEPNDPFNLWLASEDAAKGGGQPGSAQSGYGSPLGSGQTAAQPDYETAGGTVVGDLVFPGSAMKLSITDPAGKVYESSTATGLPTGKLVEIVIPNGPPGAYKVSVSGLDVNPAEEYSVTLSTKFDCAKGDVESATAVRHVLSAADTAAAINQSGSGSGLTAHVSFGNASSGGAIVHFDGAVSGVNVIVEGVLYAAAGGTLGVGVTAATVNGFDVKQQTTQALSGATGKSFDGIDLGYKLDRLYTCAANQTTFLVFEGHN
ncbi:MAG: hypothetical protein NVS9B1_23430 [Candidatus Dormibacteraceae bacterium]